MAGMLFSAWMIVCTIAGTSFLTLVIQMKWIIIKVTFTNALMTTIQTSVTFSKTIPFLWVAQLMASNFHLKIVFVINCEQWTWTWKELLHANRELIHWQSQCQFINSLHANIEISKVPHVCSPLLLCRPLYYT